MKLIAEKSSLMEALTLARGNVHTENVVSTVYECVMFEALPEGLWVHASDGMTWSQMKIRAEVEDRFRMMIRAKQLTSLVSNLGEGDVEIKFVGLKAILKSGTYTAEFSAESGMEFPTAKKLGNAPLMTMPAKDFIETVRAVEGSAYTAPDRPFLCGVNFSPFDGGVEVVAADGARMSAVRRQTAVSGSPARGTAGTDLARQWCSLAKLRPRGKNVSFGFVDGWGIMVGDGAIVTGLLPDQRFPNWKAASAMIQDDDPLLTMEFDRGELEKAVGRAVAIGAKIKGAVAINVGLYPDSGAELIANAASRSSRETVAGRLSRQDVKSGFRKINGDLFLQALASMKNEKVLLSVTAHPGKPLMMNSIPDKKNPMSVTHYLMPRS